jgi:cytochrome c
MLEWGINLDLDRREHMHPHLQTKVSVGIIFLILATSVAAAQSDPQRGKALYQVCNACHSINPGVHRTGPSLAAIWGQKAGAVEGFERYSPALMQADILWDNKSLDAWLSDPKTLVPGNWMGFQGLPKVQDRQDLIAYLKQVTDQYRTASSADKSESASSNGLPDLKKIPPAQTVQAIRYCRGTYHIRNLTGDVFPYWEYNLRFKTDTSSAGPNLGKPALVPTGMRGDRAQVVFSAPAEISALIEESCQ